MTSSPIRIAATRGLLTLALLTAATPLRAQLLNPQLHDNAQPSIGLTYFLDQLGFVRMTAADFVPPGFARLDGNPLLISNVPGYFSSVGTTWGGNGTTTVGVPNAEGRVIVGADAGMSLGSTNGADGISLTSTNFPASQGGSATAFDNRQPGVVMRYAIRTSGFFPDITVSSSGGPRVIGTVLAFAGAGELPAGWMFADGQVLSINENLALFSLLGSTYGGDGRFTFALPDLRGRTPIGTGNGISLGDVSGSNYTTITEGYLPWYGGEVSNHQASLGLSFRIATSGTFPQRSGAVCPCSATNDVDGPLLGEVNMFAWQSNELTGQLMSIAQNTALFSLLGTNFGGNGLTTFGLPDLQGRVVVGARDGAVYGEDGLVGARYGSDTFVLSRAPAGNDGLDPKLDVVQDPTVVPEPATAVLTLVGLGALLAVGRRRRA